MSAYVALLRAVNVGGTGKLPMSELKAMCEAAGFEKITTYIASGNVVFVSALSETRVRQALENRLAAYAGKPVGVLVRTAQEMAEVLKNNPFPDSKPNFTVAVFLDEQPGKTALEGVRNRAEDETIALGKREIYVSYGSGMGRSKLAIPAAKEGTARNMNTIAKLAEMAGALT